MTQAIQTRVIDCKMKEMYYEVSPIKEAESTLKSRFDFWKGMNCVALQNITFQQVVTKS